MVTKNGWLTLLAVSVLSAAYAVVPGTARWCGNCWTIVESIYAARNASREERAYAVLGEPYRLISFVAEKTPASSRILIPSDARHFPLSSRIWCLYYLYPRRVVQLEDVGEPLSSQADFILVHDGWGLDLSGYPPEATGGIRNGYIGFWAGEDSIRGSVDSTASPAPGTP